MKKHLTLNIKHLTVLFILFTLNLYAQSGTDLEFMNLGTGARALALGGAYTAISNDANSPYWNPAGMNLMDKAEATYMHRNLYFDTNFDYFSGVFPLKVKSSKLKVEGEKSEGSKLKVEREKSSIINYFGLGVVRVSTGDIPITDTTGTPVPGTDYNEIVYKGVGGYSASAYFISYGRKFSSINAGLSLRMLNMEILNVKGTGYGLDMGLIVPYRMITYGLMLRGINFGKIKWDTGHYDNIVPILRTGIAITVKSSKLKVEGDRTVESSRLKVEGEKTVEGSKLKGEREKGEGSKLIITGEIEQEIKTSNQAYWHNPKYHLGLEWSIMGLVGIRCGYDTGNFSAGIGFRSEHIYVDYAYTTHPELRGTHSISIGIR